MPDGGGVDEESCSIHPDREQPGCVEDPILGGEQERRLGQRERWEEARLLEQDLKVDGFVIDPAEPIDSPTASTQEPQAHCTDTKGTDRHDRVCGEASHLTGGSGGRGVGMGSRGGRDLRQRPDGDIGLTRRDGLGCGCRREELAWDG